MTQNCQMKVTSSGGDGGRGSLHGLRRMPKANIRWTFLMIFPIFWATHHCSAAAVATEINTEPITTSISITEEMTTPMVVANDSTVHSNLSSSSTAAAATPAVQPVNQQLSLYAIDGDTLDRLFAQYISNVLSSKQLLHTTDGSNFGGLVDIRKDQQLQQVVAGSSGSLSVSPNEKAVILLKGSHSQLVINGNLVQYIYNVDSTKCNLAQHHTASSSAPMEKPEASLESPKDKEAEELPPPLAVIKSISQHLPVANLSSQSNSLTTTATPIATEASAKYSSSFSTTPVSIIKPTTLESSSSSQIAPSLSTRNIDSAIRVSTHSTAKRLFTRLPTNSVTENLSFAKSTYSTNDSSSRRSDRPKQSVNNASAAWSSITSTTSTIRPRVSIVVTPMSTTRSTSTTAATTLALTATTAAQQQDSLISIKWTSTAKSSFTGSSRSRSTTVRPSFTTTTSSTAAPLTDQLTTMNSIKGNPSNGQVSSRAPPFTLTFAPSPSSSSVGRASTRLSPFSPSSSSPSIQTSPWPASMFPTTLSTLTTSSSTSAAALPSKLPLFSKGPTLISSSIFSGSSSSTTTAPSRSTKSESSTLSTSASSHSLNSSANSSDKVNPTVVSLTTMRSTAAAAVNDLSANSGSPSSLASANSSNGSSGISNASMELSTVASATTLATATASETGKRIVLASIHNKTASSAMPFSTSTTPPSSSSPFVTAESILDNTIDVEVNNRSSSTPTISTVKFWSTEKPKLTEEVMDQSEDKIQPAKATITVSTNASTTTTTSTKIDSLKTSLSAVKISSTRRPSPGSQSSSSKTKVTRFPSPIVSWHRNQSSTPPSTLSVKQALKTTIRLRPPSSTKKQSSTTTRFVPTRFIYPMAPTSPTSLASSTRARQPFDELYELKRRFIENKRNFFSRILSTTTTRRPVVLFPSFAKWIIQGNAFRQGR